MYRTCDVKIKFYGFFFLFVVTPTLKHNIIDSRKYDNVSFTVVVYLHLNSVCAVISEINITDSIVKITFKIVFIYF